MTSGKCELLYHCPLREDKKIYEQPWYKERLRMKYIKCLDPKDTSPILNAKNWTFIKDGLDDFRDGLPPLIEDDVIIKGPKGLSPNIRGSSDNLSSVKKPAVRGRFSKEEICFSRATPLQQQQREHIEEIEYGLLQHPLALYPHLEECLPPDVFEDVVDVLDPEMNLASDEENGDEIGSASESSATQRAKSRHSQNSEDSDEEKVRNPYRWLPKKEEKEKTDKKKTALRHFESPAEDEHIKKVTKEFCEWVASLGGESNNIEESTITSLFASGYETKPALSVPIHVVELTNVPPELRMSAAAPPPEQPQQKPKKETKKGWGNIQNYEPSWVKFKYGAWYLNPKTWKKRIADEPLIDPKEIKEQEMSEAKKKSNDLNYDLASMHGSQAFIEFIEKKGCRKPEFLEHVSKLQQQQAAEEAAKLEVEAAKQHRQLSQAAKGSKFK